MKSTDSITNPTEEVTTMSTTAHRYADINAIDSDGTTPHYDLCKPCAKVLDAEDVIDVTDEMECPEVDYDEGYRCDRCDRRISLS